MVVAGIAIGALPGFSAIVYFWLPKHTNQAGSIFQSPPMALAGIALLAAPLSITYAVLRHRLFDVNFIIRMGLQYQVARKTVVFVPSAISLFMILETLRLRDLTVNEVLDAAPPVPDAGCGGARGVFRYRRALLKAIDRHFFRERYSAYEILHNVAEQVRRAVSLDEVAPLVVAKIESTMRPEFAALLVRDPSTRTFRTITAAPSAEAPADLLEDSKLAALARVVEGPLDTSEDGDDSVLRHLPAADLEWVRRARIDTLIPVITHDDQLHAVLLLGPKRSAGALFPRRLRGAGHDRRQPGASRGTVSPAPGGPTARGMPGVRGVLRWRHRCLQESRSATRRARAAPNAWRALPSGPASC